MAYTLECEGSFSTSTATEEDIDRAFDDNRIRGEFIILTTPNGDFMQASNHNDGPFTLEHRCASGKHIQAIGDCSKDQMREAFHQFLRGDGRWRTSHQWRTLEASPEIAACEKCGVEAPGRQRWMFYGGMAWLVGEAVQREFYCFRCLRLMRMYAIIGLSLITIVVGALVAATVWLVLGGP